MQSILQLAQNQRDFNTLTTGLKEVIQHNLKWYSDLSLGLICKSVDLELSYIQYMGNTDGFLKTVLSKCSNEFLLKNAELSSLFKIESEIVSMARELIASYCSCLGNVSDLYSRFKLMYDEFVKGLTYLLHKNLEVGVNIDFLTQLPNRHALDTFLKEEYIRITANQNVGSIALIDIDMFKHVNDSFGHIVGDRVLRGIANIYAEHIRDFDFLARFGGEEFILYMPNTSLQEATSLAEDLRLRAQNYKVDVQDRRAIKVTCSFGISQLDTCKSIEKAIIDADIALYSAKKNGRNCIMVN